MNWKEQYQHLIKSLLTVYDQSEANAIAKTVTESIGKGSLLKLNDQQLTSDEMVRLDDVLKQLLKNRPVQYVLNEAWFYGLKFEVNENVLIPRPETEELVDWIVKDLRTTLRLTSPSDGLKNKGEPPQIQRVTHPDILDIGTGSGCIPITIKKNIPAAEVSAIDVCSEALHTAINNAVNHETEINFQLLDFLDEPIWNELGKYDIIVSNPPYIKTSEAKNMSEHVLQYEPHKALFVPDDDALLFYRKIADFSLKHLNKNGVAYLEINQQLGNETSGLFQQKGFTVELKKDMSGNERMVKAVINN
jgi:release factor glutamine methyltransferase